MVGLIDLNTVEDDEAPSPDGTSSSSSSSSSSLSFSGVSASISNASSSPLHQPPSLVCLELWHACSGPRISLPTKGAAVVYFPQGQLELAADLSASACDDLPAHIFCRVVDVKLHADSSSDDDAYAQVSLVAESEQIEAKLEAEVEEHESEPQCGKSVTPHMFCKTLTASDTSTHGGFSVPRRAAEDCFPPLDYSQQRPSQELVAKDLHGVEWRFRHIYRGQPRRHLLTTGWSGFINKKILVSGDAVLFLRGEDGELRLGIRRAATQSKGGGAAAAIYPSLRIQQLNQSALIEIPRAISIGGVFNVYYDPRVTSSAFIIPYRKFFKSLDSSSFTPGLRFKMCVEAEEDSSDQRRSGLITGIGDIDPVRWPGSKWRCLSVRWDDMEGDPPPRCNSRICPWEIESSSSVGSVSGYGVLMMTGCKRSRFSVHPNHDHEFPSPNGFGAADLSKSSSLRFQKVLQGQENRGFSEKGIIRNLHPPINSPPYKGTCCYGESFGEFHHNNKVVLQSQETFPLPHPLMTGNEDPPHPPRKGIVFGRRSSSSIMMNHHNVMHHSSTSSVLLTFPPPRCPSSSTTSKYIINNIFHCPPDKVLLQNQGVVASNYNNTLLSDDEAPPPDFNLGSHNGGGCRLFGFSLLEADKVAAAADREQAAAAVSKANAKVVVGNDCSIVHDLYSVRARGTIFDVAL